MSRNIHFTRTSNDVNGNPRYVVHFLDVEPKPDNRMNIHDRYLRTVKLANSIGGRKHSTKQFGGCIVFQSHSLDELEAAIERLKRKHA